MTDFICPACSHEFSVDGGEYMDFTACPKCGDRFAVSPESIPDGEGGSGLAYLLEPYEEPAEEPRRGGICFIQLSSFGDLCSLMPIWKARADAGAKVWVMTRPEYVEIFEAISYATPIPVDIPVAMPWKARAKADGMGFDEVIVSQVVNNKTTSARVWKNYQTQEWCLCGMIEKYHDLPLIFDRRDAAGEAAALAKHLPSDDGRPLLCFNLIGKSSPYDFVDQQRGWIKHTFSESFRLLDLGALRLDKVHHLIAFVEAADVLITVDTLTLHLAYATMTPTIAFLPGTPRCYAQSEPRAHWAYACTYGESVRGEYREPIVQAVHFSLNGFELGTLCRTLDEMTKERVFHAVDYTWADDAEKRRVLNAYRSWDAIRFSDGDSFQTIFTEHGPERVAKLVEVINRAFLAPFGTKSIIVWSDRFASLPSDTLKLARELREGAKVIAPGVVAMRFPWWLRASRRLIRVDADDGEASLRKIIKQRIRMPELPIRYKSPVRKSMCETCPFRAGSKFAEAITHVIAEYLEPDGYHLCHSTGGEGEPLLHLCRGAERFKKRKAEAENV